MNPFIDGPFEPLRREFVITSDGQPLGEFLKGFGRDQSDELYVCTSIDLAPSGTSGTVYRIVGPPATPLPEPEPPGCGPMPCLPETKQRYISFGLDMVDAGKDTGLRVKMTSLHHPAAPVPPGTPSFAGFEGQFRYVNLLGTGTCPDSAVRGTSVRCGVLSCTPEYRDWTTFLDGRTLHVTGAEIVPDSTYGVAHLAAACAGSEATCAAASTELPVKTARWGNVDGSGTNAASDVNVTDIATVVNKVKDLVSGTVIKPPGAGSTGGAQSHGQRKRAGHCQRGRRAQVQGLSVRHVKLSVRRGSIPAASGTLVMAASELSGPQRINLSEPLTSGRLGCFHAMGG